MNESIKNLKITNARKEDDEIAAQLMYLAFDKFAQYLFGTTKAKAKLRFFQKLWLMDHNRMSSEYSFMMREGEKPVGLLSCYGGELINKMFLPSLWAVIKINPAMVKYILSHPHYLYALLTSPEAFKDEYYIFMLAVLPDYQGHGIGTQLLEYAEKKAKAAHFKKISLLVRIRNENAIKLYEKFGFKKVKTYHKKPMHFHKMVKELEA